MEAGLFLFRGKRLFCYNTFMKKAIFAAIVCCIAAGGLVFIGYRQYVVERYLIKAKLSQRMSSKELSDSIKAEVISRRMQQLFTQQLDIKTQLQDSMDGHLSEFKVQSAQMQEQFSREIQQYKTELEQQLETLRREQEAFMRATGGQIEGLKSLIVRVQSDNRQAVGSLQRQIGGVNVNSEKALAQMLDDIRRIEKLVERQDRAQRESLGSLARRINKLETMPSSGGGRDIPASSAQRSE
jgi:hypothetical protein